MKRLFTILLFLCILFANTPIYALTNYTYTLIYAKADEIRYGRAITRDAYFCSNKDLSSALFAIPYTYCVTILAEDGDWYAVRYAEDMGIYKSISGYCKKDKLLLLTEKPAVTYLYKAVTVSYTADESVSGLPGIGNLDIIGAYYGSYNQGPTAFSYVLCQGSFGYIKGANDDYALNPIESDTPEKPPENNDNKTSDIRLTLVVIIGTIVAVAFATMIALSKKQQPDT